VPPLINKHQAPRHVKQAATGSEICNQSTGKLDYPGAISDVRCFTVDCWCRTILPGQKGGSSLIRFATFLAGERIPQTCGPPSFIAVSILEVFRNPSSSRSPALAHSHRLLRHIIVNHLRHTLAPILWHGWHDRLSYRGWSDYGFRHTQQTNSKPPCFSVNNLFVIRRSRISYNLSSAFESEHSKPL
jgi:hypothetical protein